METEASSDKAIDPRAARLAGKYMTFRLKSEDYGVGILKVRELIGRMKPTRVAKTPDYIHGVINLRGKVIPVLDLGMRFGLGPTEETEHSVIIVVQYECEGEELTMGIIVDEALEVLNVTAETLEPPPRFPGSGGDLGFVLGIAKPGNDRVVFLLDVDRVLTSQEALALPSRDN